MRFRTSGRNWEGRRWELVPCLVILARQIDSAYPESHSTDGTVANRPHDHNSPNSDHRPKPTSGPGKVRALDFGENVEDDVFRVLEAIRKSRDKRIKYVIHEGRLFSSYWKHGIPPFTWRKYTGPSFHGNHGHVSTFPEYDNHTGTWNIGQAPTRPDPIDPSDWTEELIMALPTLKRDDGYDSKGTGGKRAHVKRAQGLLLANGFPDPNSNNPKTAVDGLFGPGTESSTKSFQGAAKITVDGIIGPVTWTKLLGE